MGKAIEIIYRKRTRNRLQYTGSYYHTIKEEYLLRVVVLDPKDKKQLPKIISACKVDGYEMTIVDGKFLNLSVENVLKNELYENKIRILLAKLFDYNLIESRFEFKIHLQFRGKLLPEQLYAMVTDRNDLSAKDHRYIVWPMSSADACKRQPLIHFWEKDRYIFDTMNGIWIQDYRGSAKEFRIPVKEIEKVYFHRKFMDTALINTDRENEFNGKEDWLELDLENPDMEMYEKMRAIDADFWIKWKE